MNPKRIGDLMNNRRSKMHVQSHCKSQKNSQTGVHVLLQSKGKMSDKPTVNEFLNVVNLMQW